MQWRYRALVAGGLCASTASGLCAGVARLPRGATRISAEKGSDAAGSPRSTADALAWLSSADDDDDDDDAVAAVPSSAAASEGEQLKAQLASKPPENTGAAAREARAALRSTIADGHNVVLVEVGFAQLDGNEVGFDAAATLEWIAYAFQDFESVQVVSRAALTNEFEGVSAKTSRLDLQAFGEAVSTSKTTVVFSPRSVEEMVATRRILNAAAGVVVVLNHGFGGDFGGAMLPRELDSAETAYCVFPLGVAAGGPLAAAGGAGARVVLVRRHPLSWALSVDVGQGFERIESFRRRPEPKDLAAAVKRKLGA
ncbi:hypothetical protein M885DRAFT_529435 [Pelagophyceae sp. CCMP2097]|nr:hypothetical protein M885DRAFT_529435 [Pelagophyceae sp. CCMP2097]